MTRSERHESLAALQERPFDVLVVGGGITGAGVARDAALRGLRTALVERDDCAAGTSSRSSRLVHGGVRYLEHGHLGLVFESSRERRILLRRAPHLVRPLRSPGRCIAARACRGGRSRPGSRCTTRSRCSATSGRTDRWAAAACSRASPRLTPDGLRGGATYLDAATDDARLTLANALSARDAGATVVNHAAVARLAFGPDGVRATIRVRSAMRRTVRAGARRSNCGRAWSSMRPARGATPCGRSGDGAGGAHERRARREGRARRRSGRGGSATAAR